MPQPVRFEAVLVNVEGTPFSKTHLFFTDERTP
jgi:hypothetical protein